MSIPLDSSASSDSGGGIEASLVTDPAGLAALEADWQRLADAEPHAGVFAGPGFHRALREAFAPRARLAVVVLRTGNGDLCGILPFEHRRVRRRGLPLRELGFLRNPHMLGNCLLLGPSPQAALQAALAILRRRGGWDTLLLEDVVPPPGGLGFVACAAAAEGFALDPWRTTRQMGYLPVAGTFEDYLQGRSKNFRTQLRRYERDAAALGTVSYERVHGPAAIRAALPAVFDLERRSRKGVDSRTAMGEADHRFHLRLTETLPPAQVGELWLMRIGEHVVGALRLLADGNVLYAHLIFHAVDAAGVSPGKLVMREALRSAWERRLDEVDFRGDSLFISRWSQLKRRYVSTRLYAPGAYGWILHRARQLERRWRGDAVGHD